MTTIDLSAPPAPPTSLLDGLPRRVALTLPELQLVASRAGGAPLPFDVRTPGTASGTASAIESRLGTSRGTTQDQAYLAALTALHDPGATLARRGLVVDGLLDKALAGAVGLLATPTYAVDLDVAVEQVQLKAWHRTRGTAVATLATSDGIVFELAWFPTSQWADELARVVALPQELQLRESGVPPYLDLPYELADAAVEAAAGSRSDLLQVVAAQHDGATVDGDGRPFPAAEVPGILQALGTEAQGRVRALVVDATVQPTTVVGVRSWLLLADGWRTLHPHDDGDQARVGIRAVEASELAADLAPVLAEVQGGVQGVAS